jgi:zinc transporter, ZIP family
LVEDGFEEGGIWPIAAGAVVRSSHTLSRIGWSRYGGHHRRRSGDQQQKPTEGGGLAIAIGSLFDGVPELVVLGLGLLAGQGVSTAMPAAIFLSNLPEGLSSALGMKRAGRSKASYLAFESV